MYAIVNDNGRQFKVRKGEKVLLDHKDVEKGKEITFDEVTFYSDSEKKLVGAPTLENVTVKAEVLGENKASKIVVFKMKRRKRYRVKQGHRQKHTEVRITDISLG